MPGEADAHYNLAVAQKSLGLLDDAAASYRRALKIKPDYAEAHSNLGNVLKDLGRLDESVTCYRRALALKPDSADAHNNLGAVLKDLGQLDEAVACYRRAIKIKPDYADAHYNLGNALKDLGRLDEAAASYRRALEVKPDFADAYNNLGTALKDLGQPEAALASYRRLLELKPDFAEAHNNLGVALKDLGQLDAALASYRRAVELKPDYAEAHNNMGTVMQTLGQNDAALANYRLAVRLKPDFADAYYNLGVVLKDLGLLDEAVANYRTALKINPDFAQARENLSMALLSLGQYPEAWRHFEARYDPNMKDRVASPDLNFPQWQGESLTEKSLVIWPEQGLGDEIQFARYIPMLKFRGVTRITLVCKSPLKDLLGTLEGVDAVVSLSEAASLPFHDYWTFPMSLPLHFSTTVETIPAGLPYLSALPERLDLWRYRLPSDGLKVGLAWKGSAGHKNDANRSLPNLSALAALWSVPGVTFVSLQKGQGEEESATPPTGQPIIHLGADIRDFADTAAIVDQLDLVISIDTAIAHLAGALKKPCWVLLPSFGTDWRWFRERADSPWYPGVMRLFRQTKAGDWATTINEVLKALRAWVE